MSNLENALNSDSAKHENILDPFGEWKDNKKAEREWAFQTIDVQAQFTFADNENLYRHLRAQSRLMHMSATNVLLLVAQLPQVSDIEKYGTWEKRGHPIKRGEKGLVTLIPGAEYIKDDGSTGINWTTGHVFDVTQTAGDPPLESSTITNLRGGAMLDFMSMVKALMQNAPAEIEVVDKLTSDEPAAYKDGKILIPDVKDTEDFKQIITSIYALGYGCTAAYRQQQGLPNDPLVNACGGILGNFYLGTLPPMEALEFVKNNAPEDTRGQKRILGGARAAGEKLLAQIEKTRVTYRTEHAKSTREQMIEHKHKNTERSREQGS